ncbi:methylated-DNA--[protein]-cysteine S-methyltransferase [Actinomyces sp. oral taxon 448]|uniref:methylated-DNA--[protein]-cysteine S-methyltransferase n=1 Tax=Actinomyces sp. oral taxon 448 TaxID=712124 RepID=UPI003F8CCD02
MWFDGQKYNRSTINDDAVLRPDLPVFTQTTQWLDTYFEGADPGFTPTDQHRGLRLQEDGHLHYALHPLRHHQHLFLHRYRGRPANRPEAHVRPGRGGAVGRNPITLIVPCHRVVGANGSLRGYAGGIDRKERLLEMEGVNMTGLSTPPTADDVGGTRE